MAFHLHPRDDLPPSDFGRALFLSRPTSGILGYETRRRSRHTLQKPKKKQCYDWVFSSSTNVHIAIDKAAFKTYAPISSYVLSLSGQHKIEVNGIGAVELKIRCKPGSKSDRVIVLENVLHISNWYCNIFSDTYFTPTEDYEHTWTDFGVSFMCKEKGKLRSWGYTENFQGLDKLVLARKHDGRSPMLEDKEREVYSVNVTWPQSQRDRWNMLVVEHETGNTRSQLCIGHTTDAPKTEARRPKSGYNHRPRLSEISVNALPVKKVSNKRISSLRATVSNLSLKRSAAPI